MSLGPTRLVALLGATGMALTVGYAPGAANAADDGEVRAAVSSQVPQSEWCARPMSRLELYRGTSGFEPPTNLTLLDETQQIDLNTFSLAQSPFTDVSRVLWYRSLLWLAVSAANYHEAGRDDLAEQMAVPAIRAATEFPDPGSATPEALNQSNTTGWDEGTAFRRAEALMCLSSYTGVARIDGLLRMHADALVDENRYKGPPQRAVNNHGLLANLVLLDLAARLDAPYYREVAISRLLRDADQVFSAGGWSNEGSTMYQSVNIDGWRDVADALRARGYAAEAADIDARLTKARELVAHLVGPTGQVAAIGNTRLDDAVVRPAANPARPLYFADTDGGIASGRWSWSDTNTSWWTALNQGRTGGHGHDDNTALTWHTLGIPALVDVGQYDYDDFSPITMWMNRAVAHNRAIPETRSADLNQIRTLAVRRKGSMDRITMTSSDKGSTQSRVAYVDDARHSLEVTDTGSGRLEQYWHLAPGWVAGEATPQSAQFTGPSGRVLRVSTSPGTTLSVVQPSLNPIAGLLAVSFKQLQSAPEIRVTGDSSMVTTFQMFSGVKSAARTLPTLTAAAAPGDKRATVSWSWGTTGGRAKKATPADPKQPKKTQVKVVEKAPPKNVTGYRVQMRLPVFGWTTVKYESQQRQTLTRRKLPNGVPLLFRVAPLTKSGQGPYTEPVEVTPVGAPDKPTTPTVTGQGRRVSLSWVAPVEQGGAKVRGYEVTAPSGLLSSRRPTVLLRDLKPGPVRILVRAKNRVGLSSPLRVTLNVDKKGRAALA